MPFQTYTTVFLLFVVWNNGKLFQEFSAIVGRRSAGDCKRFLSHKLLGLFIGCVFIPLFRMLLLPKQLHQLKERRKLPGKQRELEAEGGKKLFKTRKEKKGKKWVRISRQSKWGWLSLCRPSKLLVLLDEATCQVSNPGATIGRAECVISYKGRVSSSQPFLFSNEMGQADFSSWCPSWKAICAAPSDSLVSIQISRVCILPSNQTALIENWPNCQSKWWLHSWTKELYGLQKRPADNGVICTKNLKESIVCSVTSIIWLFQFFMYR